MGQMTEGEGDSSIYKSIIMYYDEYAKQWQTFRNHPNVRMYILKFKEHFAHNPFLQMATFIVIASLLTPILLFIVFAIVSAVFAFVGFMMIQVTVLAIGASILSCILFCIASTFIMIGLCIVFIYYALYYTKHVFNLLTCSKV
ncbi:hypothetical protein DMN91_009297 [Ooceraea biroi]|uniref:Promethin-A n=1 Tax=Ooceraea biroi TaxID=2015173 RepID=A0A3L8DG98_OOCBI|nr:uncharacterized protein LOC105276171 [Ooceraea biroi]RLU18939.1 hypothetical protein DMN91_009297 [Ooceraea biroi]